MAARTQRSGSLSTLWTFILGVPLGLSLVHIVQAGYIPIQGLEVYVKDELEHVEVVVFACGLVALSLKLLAALLERSAFRGELVPEWKGTPVPAEKAGALLSYLQQRPGRLLRSLLGRRIENILSFVQSRGSASELDDQMRSLSDADQLALESSYSLVRFMTWAIPILGFLGTVVGITEAIANVSPEALEKDVKPVTEGLALAFGSTALGLFLTMVLMFCSFLTERIEQGVLLRVDAFVDAELAHRFQRAGLDTSGMTGELRRHGDVLISSMETLVEKQALVWAKTIDRANQAWNQSGVEQQKKLQQGLEDALAAAFARHIEHQTQFEDKLLVRHQAMLQAITQLAGVLQKTGEDHQKTLLKLVDGLKEQTQALTAVQEGEKNLLRLQESLNNNLASLSNTGMFEQAVESLTAAVSLLSAKLQGAATVRKAS
jgi:biopolymer transport protein ExbB/TolQ